jgi:hypothetical protein
VTGGGSVGTGVERCAARAAARVSRADGTRMEMGAISMVSKLGPATGREGVMLGVGERERPSATTLDSPGMCWMGGFVRANSNHQRRITGSLLLYQ